MSSNSENKEKIYQNILKADGSDDLFTFIREEHFETLYDYIFRMTGNCDLSYKIVSQTEDQIIQHYKKLNLNSYDLFKVFLYKTARSFCEDYITADTSKLENSGYEVIKKDTHPKKMAQIVSVEKKLQSISPLLREVLLLKYRAGFSSIEIAQIISSTKVDEMESQAISLLVKLTDIKEDNIKRILSQIPKYVHIESKIEETKALSQIIGGLKDNSIVPHILYIIFKALILVAIGVGCFYLGKKYK